MAIPSAIIIQNGSLPDEPGVYFYYDVDGEILYVGKATSLKKRVGSYFTKAHDARIEELVRRIREIRYETTPTVIEALVLEANQIKALKPIFNIRERDDKSFLYLTFTNEAFPRPEFVRGQELERMGIDPFSTSLSKKAKDRYIAIFGPYTNSRSMKTALDLVRKILPWSKCEPPQVTAPTPSPPSHKASADLRYSPSGRGRISNSAVRPCFDRQIGLCPGVCTGEVSKTEYRAMIRNLIRFFNGEKLKIVKDLTKQMQAASKRMDFEKANELKKKIFALEHIQDIALITREDSILPVSRLGDGEFIDLNGRIEGYDISNISGQSAVGVMVVFNEGKPDKSNYRKFRIKTVKGANDVGMLEEVIRRRIRRNIRFPEAWPLPELMVIDGGKGQVNRVQSVLDEFGISVPILGIAKGPDRKQDRLVYDKSEKDLHRVVAAGKELFQKVRDESHRFAVKYHRNLRGRRFLNK